MQIFLVFLLISHLILLLTHCALTHHFISSPLMPRCRQQSEGNVLRSSTSRNDKYFFSCSLEEVWLFTPKSGSSYVAIVRLILVQGTCWLHTLPVQAMLLRPGNQFMGQIHSAKPRNDLEQQTHGRQQSTEGANDHTKNTPPKSNDNLILTSQIYSRP